jgi:uncharacterized protein YecE (DUF72 family)
MKYYIGTSGYSYSYWKGKFYPDGVPVSKWLEYYSKQFNALELNNTFYRFPTVKNLKKAADVTPDDFKFAVKVNKSITHTKRMQNVNEGVTDFTDIVTEGLGKKLGCMLYQLPPSYSFSVDRLNDIINNVDKRVENVIEFRHVSWWKQEIYDTFKEHSLHFCSVSFPGLPEDNIVTGIIFYKRMHGVPELFKSKYNDKELKQLAKNIPKAGTAFVFFNNTMFEAGYENAYSMQELININNLKN